MFHGERSRSAWLLLLTFLLVCPSLPSRAQARDPKLDALAAKLMASAARKIPGYGGPGKVTCVVLDFREDEEAPTRLGVRLADEFSQALAQKASGITVLDRATLHGDPAVAARGGSSQVTQQEAASYAHSVGAEIAVMGSITKQRDSLVVNVRFVDATGEDFAEASQRLERTPGLRALEKLLPRETPPTEGPAPIALPALPAGQAAPPEQVGNKGPWPDVPSHETKASGIFACLYCPSPGYTFAAQQQRIQGKVFLDVQVGEDGSVRDVVVKEGLPGGLTELAVATVKLWRFKPFMGPDGKAKAVKIPIELNFKLAER